MSTTQQMREQLKAAYKYNDPYRNREWWDKVDKMPDKQVIAILIRLKLKGKVK